MFEIAPSSGPLPSGNTKGPLYPQCQEFRFARGHDHWYHDSRVDASSPRVEKSLFEFFGWKVLACAVPFFRTKLTDRPENCSSKNSFSNRLDA